MAWILLIIAGLFEIGWPLGFKLASMHSKYFIWFIGLSILSMGLSGYFLYLAQKSIPIGTAYVIWTGIGAIGTVLLGILFFHDSANIFRLFVLIFDIDRDRRVEISPLIRVKKHQYCRSYASIGVSLRRYT